MPNLENEICGNCGHKKNEIVTPNQCCGFKTTGIYNAVDQVTKGFEVKDSGKREQFEGGMQRDVTEGKVDYSLVLDGPMFRRWAEHLTKGAVKYEKRNWMKAQGEAEYQRFRESALRHFIQWFEGQTDEDHASAVYFNINGAEFLKERH